MENPLDNQTHTTPDESSPTSPTEDVPTRKHRVVTKELVDAQITHLRGMIESQIEEVREKKTPGSLRFLRGLVARLREISKDFTRVVTKPPKRVSKAGNQNSGFLKAHSITPVFAEFAGWGVDEKHSRVDITKAISKYIKESNLKHPTQNKLIVPDARLASLLNVTEPFGYDTLQKYIGQFQLKD